MKKKRKASVFFKLVSLSQIDFVRIFAVDERTALLLSCKVPSPLNPKAANRTSRARWACGVEMWGVWCRWSGVGCLEPGSLFRCGCLGRAVWRLKICRQSCAGRRSRSFSLAKTCNTIKSLEYDVFKSPSLELLGFPNKENVKRHSIGRQSMKM